MLEKVAPDTRSTQPWPVFYAATTSGRMNGALLAAFYRELVLIRNSPTFASINVTLITDQLDVHKMLTPVKVCDASSAPRACMVQYLLLSDTY